MNYANVFDWVLCEPLDYIPKCFFIIIMIIYYFGCYDSWDLREFIKCKTHPNTEFLHSFHMVRFIIGFNGARGCYLTRELGVLSSI